MKNWISIIFVIVITFNMSGQNTTDESKYYLGVSYGKSFPLGDFKSDGAAGNYAGFAETGNKFDLFGGYNVNEKIGLLALIRTQKFSTDAESLALEAQEIAPGTQFNVESKDWKLISFLMGGVYKVPITKKMSLLPKAMMGVMFAKSPEINVVATNGSISDNSYTKSEATAGFAYEFGIGLVSKLGKHFALMPSFDISGGFLNFNDLQTQYGNGSYLYRDYNPHVLTFNLGLALAYKF